MKWLYENLYRDKEGFTLVELMIVIIILAILTGIAVPSYMVLRDRARTSAAQSELRNMATALEMYFADNNEQYPATTFAVMEVALETGGPGGEGYMSNVPTNDPWGRPYVYTAPDPGPGGGLYLLESYGSDGATGGGDDIQIIDGEPLF